MNFKKIFLKCLCMAFLINHVSFALEGEQDLKTQNSVDELTTAFQKEYVYLTSQKSTLIEQRKKLEKNLNTKISSLKQSIAQGQKDLVWLGAANDDSHEYLLTLDRRKKDLQKRESSLESIYKKSHSFLTKFKKELYFESASNQNENLATQALVVSDVKISDFENLIEDSKELLSAVQKSESFPSSFLNAQDKLVDGEITRVGRSAAIGFSEGEYFILGPDGKGMLKALQKINKPEVSNVKVYVFDSLSEIATLKKKGGFAEKLADLSPILFLGMMLFMVLGLFVVMIRV